MEANDRLSRVDRRRAQNRESLLTAALEIIADVGEEGLRVADIAERADVGFGTFYNHFTDKADVVATVAKQVIAEQAARINELNQHLADPAEVMSVAHRLLIRNTINVPTIGWVVVRLEPTHKILEASLLRYALRDVRAGLEAGRFEVPSIALALHAVGGALVAVMRAALEGSAGAEVETQHAEVILRILGLGSEDAFEVANRPFPSSVNL